MCFHRTRRVVGDKTAPRIQAENCGRYVGFHDIDRHARAASRTVLSGVAVFIVIGK